MRSTSNASAIKSCQRMKDGRDSWLAIARQHAGKSKWDSEIRQDDFLHSSQMKGQSAFKLEMLESQLRAEGGMSSAI